MLTTDVIEPKESPIERLAKWATEIREKHAKHNEAVKTRQVLRARAFTMAVSRINACVGGGPRNKRRAMARTIANRDWRKLVA